MEVTSAFLSRQKAKSWSSTPMTIWILAVVISFGIQSFQQYEMCLTAWRRDRPPLPDVYRASNFISTQRTSRANLLHCFRPVLVVQEPMARSARSASRSGQTTSCYENRSIAAPRRRSRSCRQVGRRGWRTLGTKVVLPRSSLPVLNK